MFAAIETIKTTALHNIDNALVPDEATAVASSATMGTGVIAINNAIKAYIDKVAEDLLNAKNVARTFVNELRTVSQNDAIHDSSKFAAIGIAKSNAIRDINQATTIETVTAIASSNTQGSGIHAIKAAEKLYTDSI